MSGPRNRKAWLKSCREREIVRQALLAHSREHPLNRPLTAKELRRLTGLHISERRLQQHMLSVRTEAEIRELLDEQLDSSSTEETPAPAPDGVMVSVSE